VLGAAVAVALAPWGARAQAPALPPAPVPVLPGPAGPAAVPPGWPDFGPPPPPAPPLEIPIDPGRDGWGPYGPPSPEPGPFFITELAIIRPTLRFRLTNDTPLEPSGHTLTVPGANLGWTVAPWFDLGYVLPRSLGLVSLNYRFFNAEGNGTALLNDHPGALRSRLGENVINLDYGTTPFAFAPGWDFQWRIGVELAEVFFDSRVRNATGEQSSSNLFRGAGPHARLDVYRHLADVPGLSLFGRLESAGDLGRIDQKFREQITGPGGAALSGGTWDQNGTQMVPMILVQAGFSYVPPEHKNLLFTLGYVFEHWWYVGQLGEDSNAGAQSATRGEFGTQGVFLRGQIDF
jgi:hypothetical protein